MTSIVLIHSPFLGVSTWQGVAAELRRLGNTAVVVDLNEGAMRPGWEGHVAAVGYALGSVDIPPAVCVVHSGSGPLAPAIERSVQAPLRWVLVDASAPHPGKSRWEAMPAVVRDALPGPEGGFLPPWHRWFEPGRIEALIPEARVRRAFFAEMPPIPMALLEEPLPETPAWPEWAGAYLRLSKAYDRAASEAGAHGWHVERVDGHHLMMVTEPARVAGLVDALARRLVG